MTMYSEHLKRNYELLEQDQYVDMRAEVEEVILHPDIRMTIGPVTYDEVFSGLQASFGFAEGTVKEAIAKDVALAIAKELGQGDDGLVLVPA